MFLNQRRKWALTALVVLIAAKWGWSHRHDDWVQSWLTPAGPVKSTIDFDNGSVRDTAPAREASSATGGLGKVVKNEPGQLKKCLVAGKVVYTDQVCPAGATVAAVDGGNMVVVAAPTPAAKNAADAQGGQKRLHDMLDISSPNDQKARMMERVVNQ
jgi:hypothetical protein